MDAQLFLTIILWLIIGGTTAYYAKQRGRDPALWFMIGMLLGILGLLLLFLLPSSTAESESNKEEIKDTITLSNQTPPVLSHNYFISDWFYYDNDHNRQGPVKYEVLKSLWETGVIKEDTYIWCEGMESWKKVAEISDLSSHLASPKDSN